MWRENNLEKAREVARLAYHKHKKKWKARQTEAQRRARNAFMREYRLKNREKFRAYEFVKNEIRRGRLLKPKVCSECGNSRRKIQAHHFEGYAREKWLTIEWLCFVCHAKKHRIYNLPYVPRLHRRIVA